MEWVLGTIVILAVALSMAIVDRMRTARLRKRVRLEITNAGNVKSRYYLRAEDPAGSLEFQFTLDGDRLPLSGGAVPARDERPKHRTEPERQKSERKAQSAATARGAMNRAGKVIQLGGAVAGVMSMVASLLPRSIGGPLQTRASQIRNVQARASYAQQAPERIAFQAGSVAHTVTGKSAGSTRPGRVIHPEEAQARAAAAQGAAAEPQQQPEGYSGPPGDGLSWAQTPYVEPGGKLDVDLLVRSLQPSGSQAHTFQVISRAAGGDVGAARAPRPVSAEGSVQMRGGFWTRRVVPYVLVSLLTTILMLALVVLGYFLVAAGVFA